MQQARPRPKRINRRAGSGRHYLARRRVTRRRARVAAAAAASSLAGRVVLVGRLRAERREESVELQRNNETQLHDFRF